MSEYYDKVWKQAISLLPTGGAIRFDMRQACYKNVAKLVESNSRVYDYACGLGMVTEYLTDKGCTVFGCDLSKVAVDYVNNTYNNPNGRHEVTADIIGGRYDYILAISFLEHIENPVEWMSEAFRYTDTVIATIPNNYRKCGEHVNMAWDSMHSFQKMFQKYKRETITEYSGTERAWQAPIIKLTRGDKMNPLQREEKPVTVKAKSKKKKKKEPTLNFGSKVKPVIKTEE